MARWHNCNILHLAPDAKRLWQFDAKGGGFVLGREQRVPHAEPLPAKFVAKNWTSLWQPKLNIAWLPPENVFLRVIELPASNAEETLAMVELQLEKLSPLPVTQIVWTMQVFPRRVKVKAEGEAENLQTVVVIIAARSVVEEFLGKLERDGFLPDRLEVPMLDLLESVTATEDGAWLFPLTLGGQNAALVAWWNGGVLRNLSFVTLPATDDRAAELKNQLTHIAWSGELEGWFPAQPKWHLVADAVDAADWENVLRTGLGEPVQVSAPPASVDLAARTANRAALALPSNLLPPEFTVRHHQQFVDRLWLRGLAYAGLAYAVCVAVYFCAVAFLGYRTQGVETQVAAISGNYTNALSLKARFGVLQERQQLKFAALDCWQLVAQELPPGISLQRSSFADGRKLSLNGQVNAADTQKLIDFYDALRKVKLKEQPMFNANPGSGDQLVYRQQGSTVVWNFGLELLHTEAEAP
jgi:hypothetical protein